MRLNRLFVTLALAVPAISFAAQSDCDSSAAAQKFWSGQYAALVAHGTAALKSGDTMDAENSLAAAQKAASSACVAEPGKDVIALSKGVAAAKIDAAMLESAKLVAKGEYGRASELLGDVADYAADAGLMAPEAHTTLLKTVNEHRVADFFTRLDKAVADKKMTPDQADARAKDVCTTRIPSLKIGVPERCKKYGSK